MIFENKVFDDENDYAVTAALAHDVIHNDGKTNDKCLSVVSSW